MSDSRLSFLLAFILVLLVMAMFYFGTFVSMVTTWNHDGYSHGYIIFPIFVFLLWQKRHLLTQKKISSSVVGIAVLLLLSALWWVSDRIGVQVIQQFSVVAMVPAAVLAIFGAQVTKEIRFALGYLFFAVPFGEELIPYLIAFTASFSVDALNLVGIPVLQDGQYFHVPSGSYEVAKACAGLRYIIATLALTVLYSHLLFTKLRKALLFVGLSVALSILANGIRATVVVLLLHYTDLDIAAGKDHEFIGWMIYGVVLAVLIFVGNQYADEKESDESSHRSLTGRISVEAVTTRWGGFSTAALACIAISIGPATNLFASSSADTTVELASGLPIEIDDWQGTPIDTIWRPNFVGFTQLSLATYFRSSDKVNVALVHYHNSRQGAEISNPINSVVDLERWTVVDRFEEMVQKNFQSPINVTELVARSEEESMLIWYWLEVGGKKVVGRFETKLAEIGSKLRGESYSTAYIFAVPIVSSASESRQLLRDFVDPFYLGAQRCMGLELERELCLMAEPGIKD